MICLALDCSAIAASAAIVSDGKLLAQYYQNCGLTHSRTLLPMVENLLSNNELKLESIDLIAISHGPGSFTGLRIGVATVKGLCFGSDIPCRGVSTLEAMAQNMKDRKGIICCVMDARRSQVYNALFRSDGKSLTRLCGDRAISLEQLDEELEVYGDAAFLVGDGSQLCYNKLKYSRIVPPPPLLEMQNAYGVAMAAINGGEDISPGQLTPKYLRLSQAERERLEKMKQQ